MFICKLLPIDITNEYSYSSTDRVAERVHPNVVDRGCPLDWRSVSGYNAKSLSVDYRATRAGQQYLRTIQIYRNEANQDHRNHNLAQD